METKSDKRALIGGGLLIILGGVLLVETLVGLSEWVWIAALAVCGLGVFGLYLTDTTQWWMLIPAYVLCGIAALVAFITLDILHDTFIATFVLTVIALPFLFVFLRNREQWWALIPGGIVGLIGISFLLAEGTFKYVLPAIIILIGGWILVRQFIRQEASSLETPAITPIDSEEPTSE